MYGVNATIGASLFDDVYASDVHNVGIATITAYQGAASDIGAQDVVEGIAGSHQRGGSCQGQILNIGSQGVTDAAADAVYATVCLFYDLVCYVVNHIAVIASITC